MNIKTLVGFLIPRRRERFFTLLTLFILTLTCLYLLTPVRIIPEPKIGVGSKTFDEDTSGDFKVRGLFNPVTETTRDPNGPGEMGRPVLMLNDLDKKLANESMKQWFMNLVASDKISLDRSVPDNRPPQCKNIKYNLRSLPNASVVIIFTNEAWTPLLRTVHSVLNRSPKRLLLEIVLLDDASDREELGLKLENYVTKLSPKIKLVRKKERQGLIRARLEGAEAAKGQVVIFLDSHCEVGEGWLEPIVARIKEKRSAVLCPIIDAINDYTMEFPAGQSPVQVGGFSWSLFFTWIPLQTSELHKQQHEPVRSPTMAGGLFAAERKYFFEIGGYDPGMEIWGGENLEISFRTWMCGGSLEFVPCSHVGHVFRAGHPYNMTTKDVHGLNSARLAEVWLDDYKRLFYRFRNELKTADIGDISARVALRKTLGCQSFKWYLDNVYAEKFIPDENVKAYGMVQNEGTSICLDTLQRDEKNTINIGVFSCQGGQSQSQLFSLSNNDELRREDTCADATGNLAKEVVKLVHCHGMQGNQKWFYTEKKQIVHVSSHKCMDATDLSNSQDIVIRLCDENIPGQKWSFVAQ